MLLYWYLLHYGLLLHIISQYLCLFSLILQGLHEEGECRQLEFWTGKGVMHNFKSPETSRRIFLEYIKNIGRTKHQRGAAIHKGGGHALRSCGQPGRPPMPIFCYMVCFDLEKMRRKLLGRSAVVSRWNLGRTKAPVELFCWGNFPPGGGNRSHGHHQRSSHREGVNIHQHLHQHHLLSNPSSSLVSNLCTKISDWYFWVASSVDYSL